MEKQRAQEIFQSKGVIEVLYSGAPVWIEGIRGDQADVTYIESKKRAEVPIDRLVEGFTI